MTATRHKGLFSAFFGMELFWLFAWSDFLMGSTARLSLPFIPLAAGYFLAFALASGFRQKRLRFIWGVLGHGVAFSALAALALGAATGRVLPSGPDVFQWYRSGLTLVLAGLFWYKGTKLCFRVMSYKMVCNYFDLGLSLFFGLLLVKLLVFYQSGIRLTDGGVLYLMTGFFFIGLAAIFLSNAPTTRKRHYMEGFRGIGVMISFCMAFLLCGLGLLFVFLPLMTSMAESGYTVLKGVSGSLGPYLIHILRFILLVPKPRGAAPPPAQDQGAQDPHQIGMTGEAGWFSDLIFYGILLVVAAVALVLIGTLILRLLRFLLQKPLTGPVPARHTLDLWSRVKLIINAVPAFFRKIRLMFFSRIDTAQTGFAKLMAWGRKSGVKWRRTETPGEYAQRLQALFFPLETEILTIVHAFHLETYGEMVLPGPELDRMIRAIKKLHSPSFWPMRIRMLWKTK